MSFLSLWPLDLRTVYPSLRDPPHSSDFKIDGDGSASGLTQPVTTTRRRGLNPDKH